MNWFVIIIVIMSGNWLWDLVVDLLNKNQSKKTLPSEVSGIYDEEDYKKSQEYGRINTVVSLISSTINLIAFLLVFIMGGFGWYAEKVKSIDFTSMTFIPWKEFLIKYEILPGLVFFAGLFAASFLMSLPFSLYKTFVIEEKFGFNKTTLATFIKDRFLGLILLSILGIPLFCGVMYLFSLAGENPWSWLYVWLLFMGFQLTILYVAPTWIMPIFNKFVPLEDGELKQAIEQFARQENFILNGIFKMDGSKRSSKANAYFTGFGKNRRIVLFDTLIEKHSTEELVAILAHEIGHYKKKHILIQLVISSITTALTLYIFQQLLNSEAIFNAFQVEQKSVYASLFFSTIIIIPLDQFFGVITNIISRKNEYEADAFSAEKFGKPELLIDALKKLSKENLSNLNPHPLKVFTEYSHPPLKDRIQALKSK